MRKHTVNQCRVKEQGSGLVLAVLVLALLTGMGVALLFLSQTELRMTRAHSNSKAAFQYAESGLENGRMTLYAVNGQGPFSDDLLAAAGANLLIDFDPDAITVTYDSAGNPTGIAGFNDDTPIRNLTKIGLADLANGTYAAFLTNDPIDGVSNPVDTNNRVMITGVGFGPNKSMEIVEAIVEPYNPIVNPPPAALTLLGRNPSYDNGSSNAQAHIGDDCFGRPPGIPGLYAPIIGATDPAALSQIQGDINRPGYFTSGPFTGTPTAGDLTNPTDPVLAGSGLGTIDSGWTDCEGLKSQVEALINYADYYCNTDLGTCAVPTSGSDSDIVIIDGDAVVPGNTNYSGILLVTGELIFRGNSQWNGIMMVIGEGLMNRSGGGNGMPSGSVVVANIDPSPNGARADKSDWCSTSPDGFGQATYLTTGGGDSEVAYCSAHLNLARQIETYKITEFQQR